MFKKLSTLLAFIIICSSVRSSNSAAIFSSYADTFEVYLSSSSSGEILSVNEDELKCLYGIKGESFKRDKKDFNFDSFLEDFEGEIIYIEKLDCGIGYYGYSPKIKYRKTVKGKTINFHIFIGEKNVTVGAPIIYGSF